MSKKILAIASIGGHWIQMLRIARAMEEHYEMLYISTHPKCAAMVEGKKYYLTTDFSRSDAWKLIPTARPSTLRAKRKSPLPSSQLEPRQG